MLTHLLFAATVTADLGCWLVDESCDLVFRDGSKVASKGLCAGMNAAMSEACKLFAPDNINQWCQKELAISEPACEKSIIVAGSFGATECKNLIAEKLMSCPEKPDTPKKPALMTPVLKQFSTCPGNHAAANVHTCAQMEVTFTNSCSEVAAEISARAQGQDGWTDPHNDGHYSLVSDTVNMVTTKRLTHYYKYTDVQTFALSPTASGGCLAKMCSESQGTSADSQGTDMCDMYSLFCNTAAKNANNGVQCKYVKHDLTYTINQKDCGNWFGAFYVGHECPNTIDTCLRVPVVGGHAAPAHLNAPATPALKGPIKDGLCWLGHEVCQYIFKDGNQVFAEGMCSGLNEAVLEACKLFADELDPFCQKEAPIFETACKNSIKQLGVFGLEVCKKLGNAADCWATKSTPEPATTKSAHRVAFE